MKNMFDDNDIKDIFGKLELPDYDPRSEVIKKLGTKKVAPKRKIILITALILVILSLMGAAVNSIILTQFDMNGNKSFFSIFGRSRKFTDTRSPEQVEFENTFMEKTRDHLIILKIKEDYSGASDSSRIEVSEYEELKQYISGSGLRLPKYIPEGYSFKNASITFYLDEEGLNAAELLISEKKFGYIYEKYKFPESNLKNIADIVIYYEGKNGENIHCNIRRVHRFSENHTVGGIETSEAEVLEGFEDYRHNLFMTTFYEEENMTINSLYLYKDTEFITPVNPYILNNDFKKHEEERGGSIYSSKLGSVLYDISSYFIGKDEIIKIAESFE